ncbi:hypothetical protein D0869_03947 [Hortaea werneckii]|uniref:Uncharacterized protein n=1 Tax=Hortaea werneckii TaxID=91943 RepID=A0A3M6X493_HORWE|nr:hypothetical protein D0869_03947 [Hortaea werneckii]RMY11013.1 hypothetical protein D0868_03382 [Hortaea werneckii]
MCNGETGRAAQGGAIVILKPAALQTTPARPSLHREMSLRLAEDASSGRTMALLDRPSQSLLCPASDSASATAGAAYILIYRSGDLRSDIPANAQQPMHRFEIPTDHDPAINPGSAPLPFSLATRLDLSVGETGIIGRRASLIFADQVLGEGVIGWN